MFILLLLLLLLLLFQTSEATDQPTGPTSEVASAPQLVIWGTDVVVSETKDKFKKFINEFVDEDAEDMGEGFDPLEPLYTQRLDEVSECEEANKLLSWTNCCDQIVAAVTKHLAL